MLLKKRSCKVITLMLALLMVLSVAPVYAGEAQGPVTLSKTAAAVDSAPRYYDITLSVTGNAQPEKAVDVVLVIDRSPSMLGQPLTDVKDAAKDFASSILENPQSRVAVISYAGPVTLETIATWPTPPTYADSARTESGFKAKTDISDLEDAIDDISIDKLGTDIKSGFDAAVNLIETTSNKTKGQRYIVLMSDGIANYGSYGYHDIKILGKVISKWWDRDPNAGEALLQGYLLDYPTAHNKHTEKAYKAGQDAQMVVDKVYTVGLFDQVPDPSKGVARDTLEKAASAGCYYEAATSANMDAIYQGIAAQIGNPGSEAKVTDIIPAEFELVTDPLAPSKGTAASATDTPSAGKTTVTWTIGDIKAAETATLTYRVMAKDSVASGQFYTNDSATLTYKDPTGQGASQDFERPQVDVPAKVENTSGFTLSKYGPPVAKAGDTITYWFTLTNTGNVTLYNIDVTDPLFVDPVTNPTGLIQHFDYLAPSGGDADYYKYFSVDYTIPADYTGTTLVNTATVTASEEEPEQEGGPY